jgi:hypothetical protein
MFILILSCPHEKKNSVYHSLFRLGYKKESSSTGPLMNSGFIFQLNDTAKPLLITCHHVVAGYGEKKYYSWNELEEHVKDAWLWSQHDSSLNFHIGKNIPIRGAKASHLDLSVFTMPIFDNLRMIKPAPIAAQPVRYSLPFWQIVVW